MGRCYPSVGGCDEILDFFYVEKEVGEVELESIKNKVHGNVDEGEQVFVELIELNAENCIKSLDSKLIMGYMMYENAKKKA